MQLSSPSNLPTETAASIAGLNTRIEVSDPSRFPHLRFPLVLQGTSPSEVELEPGDVLHTETVDGVHVKFVATQENSTTPGLAEWLYFGESDYATYESLHEFLDDVPRRQQLLEEHKHLKTFDLMFSDRIQSVHALCGSHNALEIVQEPQGKILVRHKRSLDTDYAKAPTRLDIFENSDNFSDWLRS